MRSLVSVWFSISLLERTDRGLLLGVLEDNHCFRGMAYAGCDTAAAHHKHNPGFRSVQLYLSATDLVNEDTLVQLPTWQNGCNEFYWREFPNVT